MKENRWQIAFYALFVLFIIGGVVAATSISGRQSDLVAAREDIEDLEDEAQELQDELANTEETLEEVRRKYRATQEEVITAEEAEAFAIEGLSADGTNFTCLDFRCLQIKATITFFNDTDVGSSVTCVIEVEHANGKSTHTTFSSPFVPAEGEDHQRWFYYSSLSGTEIDTYDIGECHRSDESASGGDI